MVLVVLSVAACGGSSTPASPSGPDPGDQHAGDPSKAAQNATGALVADSAFRPKDHGFPFENYGRVLPDGSTPINMTPADVRAMFGDRVCADVKAGACDLIPEAQTWLDSTNREMAAGHCYGFAVAAALLWQHKENPTAFGAPAIARLDIDDNQALQREIAYDWAVQLLDSVRDKAVIGAPTEVLSRLRAALVPNPPETYTIVFFKPDGTAGHAVTPYAVEDRGGGRFDVLIYDNNWPGVSRAMVFDTKRDTWTYDAATNPKSKKELYEGNTKTESLYLFPTSPGLGVQKCPFCGKRPAQTSSLGAGTAGGTATDEIFLDGRDTDHAHLLITDDAGHRLGYAGHRLVNEIPGARVEQLITNQDWSENVEPRFVVPASSRYKVVVDATALTRADTETVGITGPDSDVVLKDVSVRRGDKDTLTVGADATAVSYTTSRAKPWTIGFGVSDDPADYQLEVRGASDATHRTANFRLPDDAGTIAIDRGGSSGGPASSVSIVRETTQGAETFRVGGVAPLTGAPVVVDLDHGTLTSGPSR